jgi:hypothetical protein
MMCVVSGTDYTQSSIGSSTGGGATSVANATSADNNAQSSYVSPEFVFKKITKFKTLEPPVLKRYNESGGGFYDWYAEDKYSTKIGGIPKESSSAIMYISNEAMFDVSSIGDSKNQYKQLVILNRENIQKKRIIEIMMKEDFIFIEPSPSDEKIIHSLSSGNGSLTSSPIYGIDQTPDKHATIIANEVYGIHATSFDELHKFHKKGKRGK